LNICNAKCEALIKLLYFEISIF